MDEYFKHQMIKNIYIEICYFVPINSIFYRKNNLDKNSPYNALENETFIGDFNARTTTTKYIILNNDSNPNF